MASLDIEKVRELMCNGAAFLEACGGDAHVTAAADRIRAAAGELEEWELEYNEEETE